MERISVFGRNLSLLILTLLLSGCTVSKMPDFAQTSPFLTGNDYLLIVEQGDKDDILAHYAGFFSSVEEEEVHEEGASVTFTYDNRRYHFTIVPNDITPEGGWAVFIVRPQ